MAECESAASVRAMQGGGEAAGRRVSEAQRTLRLMVAGGLLLVACVPGLALSVQHGSVGASALEQEQARVLTYQRSVAINPRLSSSPPSPPPHPSIQRGVDVSQEEGGQTADSEGP